VAVLVDGTYDAPTEGGDGTRKYVPRTEEELTKLTELVKKAMGFSDARQDQVQVMNVAFESEAISEAGDIAAPAVSLADWTPYARYATALILALIVVLFVVRPILSMLMAAPASVVATPVGLQEIAGAPLHALPRKDEVIALAKQNPQATAQVVKKWMREA
jgi:flagellar M-ring protein FliF